jgi:hypothetical protein
MASHKRSRANGVARPIKTQRDHEGATTVVKRLSAQDPRDSAAEVRMQSLLRELDRYDEAQGETEEDGPEDYAGPRRRWSDDASE